ncbi:MAG: hypothetical protein HY216_01745 [Candidatus Rokubacteria bacterium]|nr:hypothetical protein [Candidatus Rokubacteria bacterium]
MGESNVTGRKAYVKPAIERVDVVESEVALFGCKSTAVNKPHTTPNAAGGGGNKCSTTCKVSSPT